MELKNKVKNGDFTKNRKKMRFSEEKMSDGKNKTLKGKPEKPIPIFKQKLGETDRNFVRRMNKICMDVRREFKFEEKYGVDVKRNEDGEVCRNQVFCVFLFFVFLD